MLPVGRLLAELLGRTNGVFECGFPGVTTVAPNTALAFKMAVAFGRFLSAVATTLRVVSLDGTVATEATASGETGSKEAVGLVSGTNAWLLAFVLDVDAWTTISLLTASPATAAEGRIGSCAVGKGTLFRFKS